MTLPDDLRRHIARITNSAQILEIRLPHAITNTARRTADGYPTTTSGTASSTGGTAELTPTENAAHTNLDDLYGYNDGTRDNPTGDDTRQAGYHPGPHTQLADTLDHLKAALTCLDHAHTALTACGIPADITRTTTCRGINNTGCTRIADLSRTDGYCIDCRRHIDSNARRQRRHRAAS